MCVNDCIIHFEEERDPDGGVERLRGIEYIYTSILAMFAVYF